VRIDVPVVSGRPSKKCLLQSHRTGELKTRRSRRALFLTKGIVEALRAHQYRQELNPEEAGTPISNL
jgi:hypothetical protein